MSFRSVFSSLPNQLENALVHVSVQSEQIFVIYFAILAPHSSLLCVLIVWVLSLILFLMIGVFFRDSLTFRNVLSVASLPKESKHIESAFP